MWVVVGCIYMCGTRSYRVHVWVLVTPSLLAWSWNRMWMTPHRPTPPRAPACIAPGRWNTYRHTSQLRTTSNTHEWHHYCLVVKSTLHNVVKDLACDVQMQRPSGQTNCLPCHWTSHTWRLIVMAESAVTLCCTDIVHRHSTNWECVYYATAWACG